MHPIIQKTLYGLSPACYARHLFFGFIFPGLYLFFALNGVSTTPAGWLVVFINTFLYPYARFIYERTVAFIFGTNVFIVHAGLFLFVKFATMMTCWFLAIFIAPVGLAYLYLYHSGKMR